MLSGPMVVNDEQLRTELVKQGSDAIAVEMEGQGGCLWSSDIVVPTDSYL